jgi:transposase InsO family protein
MMLQRLFQWCRQVVVKGLQWVEQHLLRHTQPSTSTTVVGAATDAIRTRTDLLLENALLRQQLVILKRSVKRVQPTDTDRRLLVWFASHLTGWQDALLVVRPDTILAWHRRLFRLFWRQKSCAAGRPPLAPDVVALIRQMAKDNRLWGAERIQGELLKLGIHVAKRTIQKYLRQARPKHHGSQTWATFLRNHAQQIWVCDFLPITDLFFRQFYAFFLVELGSRRVVPLSVTDAPTDAWVAQQLREATPFGKGPKYLIHDHDSKFGTQFARVAAATSITVVKTPIGAPNANAVCERFLKSVRCECLDHVLLIGICSITRALKEYVNYFNFHRPHQALGQQLPVPPLNMERHEKPTRIVRTPVLGGLHHTYQWIA